MESSPGTVIFYYKIRSNIVVGSQQALRLGQGCKQIQISVLTNKKKMIFYFF